MSKLGSGSGVIKRLIGKLTATKDTALTVAVTLALIAAAGVGFAALHGASPATSAADSAALATASAATTPTLEPNLAAAATPAPPATPVPTARPVPTAPTAVPPPTLPPTAAPGTPQLTVTPYNYIYETNCSGTFSPYGITVKNTGGGTLTWQISQTVFETYYVNLTVWSGSLGAGQSQLVTPYWDSLGPGPGNAPAGSIPVTVTSNGGDQTVCLECAPS